MAFSLSIKKSFLFRLPIILIGRFKKKSSLHRTLYLHFPSVLQTWKSTFFERLLLVFLKYTRFGTLKCSLFSLFKRAFSAIGPLFGLSIDLYFWFVLRLRKLPAFKDSLLISIKGLHFCHLKTSFAYFQRLPFLIKDHHPVAFEYYPCSRLQIFHLFALRRSLVASFEVHFWSTKASFSTTV